MREKREISQLLRTFFYFLIAQFYLIVGSIPLLIAVSRTPANTFYPYLQPSQLSDMNGYLSAITMGQNHFWYFRNPYTSEPAIPSLFYFFYILIGNLSALFHIWSPVAYHIARVFCAELFIVGIWVAVRSLTKNISAWWISIFAIIATICPPFVYQEPQAFINFTPWWSHMDAVARMDSVPHHLLGQALSLIAISLFFVYLKTKSRKTVLLASLLGGIAGITFPPSILPIVIALPLSYILFIFIRATTTRLLAVEPSRILHIAQFLILPVFSLLIVWWQTQQGYHKAVWVTWEVTKWNYGEPLFNRDLFLSFGILPLLAIPAMYTGIKQKNWTTLFLTCWALLPCILLPLVNILSISKVRLTGMEPFVPFACLVGLSIHQLAKKSKVLAVTCIAIFLLSCIPVSAQISLINIHQQQTVYTYSNYYISSTTWDTIHFINTNIPKNSIIISNEYMGNILPAYAPVISYFGHINLTVNFMDKQHNVWMFYNEKFTTDQARSFLKENNISYVYFGPDEKAVPELHYPFLSPIYSNAGITIYKII